MKTAVRQLKAEKGFSLVELMIVVAIIGILATIAIPNFQRFQAKARQSEARSSLTGLYSAQKAFYQEWGQYFADFRNVGFQPEGRLMYRVGFSDAGSTNAPAGYSGAGVLTGAAQWFTTANTNVCGAALQCQETFLNGQTNPTIQPGSTIAAPGAGAPTFIAGASGDIDGDTGEDRWTINQSKTIVNVLTDLQ